MISNMNKEAQLSYIIGQYRGFLKYGLPASPTVRIKDPVAYRAAIEAEIAKIEKVLTEKP